MPNARQRFLYALAGAAPMVVVAPAWAQVTITSITRVGTGWYWPDRPKVKDGSFTLICPGDSFEKEITVESEVEWISHVGAQAGVEWGPVQASIEASLKVAIGSKKTYKVTVKYQAAPWYSRQYCIWPRYARFNVKGTDAGGTPFEVEVYVPEGTVTTVFRVPPDCPCKELSRAVGETEAYASTLDPRSPAHALVTQGQAALEAALFGGYTSLATNLVPAADAFAEAARVGADPAVLDGIMGIASTALDAGAQQELDALGSGDPSAGGLFSDPEHVVHTAAGAAAAAALENARAIALRPGPLERWMDALPLYGQAVDGVFAAAMELKEALADTCGGKSSAAPVPPLCCSADCNGDGVLDFFDFLCFQNLFAAGDPYADCDGSGGLDFFDFLCYQNAFAAGCE